ncbi:hypothetical protein ACFY3G_49290 [Streptomyces phaeochromogenes]|uniref:hypothetical protein n=1 Tax=Streptomyces phaeochromogenes TaxID=1923 RepID=UPI0036958244
MIHRRAEQSACDVTIGPGGVTLAEGGDTTGVDTSEVGEEGFPHGPAGRSELQMVDQFMSDHLEKGGLVGEDSGVAQGLGRHERLVRSAVGLHARCELQRPSQYTGDAGGLTHCDADDADGSGPQVQIRNVPGQDALRVLDLRVPPGLRGQQTKGDVRRDGQAGGRLHVWGHLVQDFGDPLAQLVVAAGVVMDGKAGH